MNTNFQDFPDTHKNCHNKLVTSATKQKGHAVDPNMVKMKDTDFNKTRATTTTLPSEMEALFPNEPT